MSPGNLHIEGSVSQTTGDIDCEGNVNVDGNVLDGRTIRAGGSIHVGGVVQAAQVTCGVDLVAKGGILGRQKAQCSAAGSITARYIVRANADAGVDIKVDGEVENSIVVARGNIVVTTGSIVGGQMTAGGNISCRIVGIHHTRTSIEAGVDGVIETEAVKAMEKVAAFRARAARIRTIVEPLLLHRKSLNPQQKERATELLFEANGLDIEIKEILDRLRENDRKMRLRPSPVIEVSETINTGVRIRMRHLEAHVDAPIHGPVTLVLVENDKHGQITANDRNGNVTDLKARPTECKGSQVLRHLAAA